MVSISIGKGQGLTQGLKAYAEYIGYDTSKITKQNWDDTITRLEYIQRDRKEANQASIYTENPSGDKYHKMLVHEGNIEFTDGEMESLFASMGLQTKGEAYESWATESFVEPKIEHGEFKINKDGNKDQGKYFEELEKVAKDYIEIFDENQDGKIDYDEYSIYKNKWFELFQPKATAQQKKEQSAKFERIFNHLNIDNEKDSKDKLDVREIMNFFFSTDAFNSDKTNGKNLIYDGYISETENTLMTKWLSEEHKTEGDHSDLVQMFLNDNFGHFFKKYGK